MFSILHFYFIIIQIVTCQTCGGHGRSSQSSDIISRSEARWREEVMRRKASAEVMLALVRQEEEEEPVAGFL